MVSTDARAYPGSALACTLGAVICDYVVWDVELANVIFKEKPGQLCRVDFLPAQLVDFHLCQSVHNDENPGVVRCR
jgi:hypothetical protein